MRFSIVAAAAITLFAACTEVSDEADRVARETAKGVVNGVLENRFPGTNTALLTDCVIDNASISEVYRIAEAAVVGASPETASLIIEIATRPETINCAADNALGALLLGL